MASSIEDDKRDEILTDGGDESVDKLHLMAGGFMTTQILCTAVGLGLPDRFHEAPMSAASLAALTNADVSSLRRFLFMMVVLGLLTQVDEDRFQLSDLGAYLRSDHPKSLAERLLYIGQVNYRAALGMSHAVTTGETAFGHIFGKSFFEFLGERRDVGGLFDRQMAEAARRRIRGVLSACDFANAKMIVDVAGGTGALLEALLRANPAARGTLVETVEVAAEAKKSLLSSKLASRMEIYACDIFQGPIPAGGDLYILSNVIHDWDDARALQILRTCRGAMSSENRLLLVEEILPTKALDAPATVASDFSMLLLTGGKERTEHEYRIMLESAAFELVSVKPFALTRAHNGRRTNWAVLECRISPSEI